MKRVLRSIFLVAALAFLAGSPLAWGQQPNHSPREYRWSVTAEPGIAYHWHRVRPVVPEVFSISSPVGYGRITVGYRFKPDWWLEVGGHVSDYGPVLGLYRRPSSGGGTNWGAPLIGGSLRAGYSGLSGRRFALYAFLEGGIGFLANSRTTSRGIRGPLIEEDRYRYLVYRKTFIQPWIPHVGVGIRPEARLTRKGRLWTYLHLSGQVGWQEAAGLNILYWTEPSHSQPKNATSRFSGSGWNIAWGWKVYLGKNSTSQP